MKFSLLIPVPSPFPDGLVPQLIAGLSSQILTFTDDGREQKRKVRSHFKTLKNVPGSGPPEIRIGLFDSILLLTVEILPYTE